MAIISSGTIGMAAIQAEFGGASSPIGLGSYYKGGSLVPSNVTGGSIPTSGIIGIGDFYGASNFTTDVIPNAVNWNDISNTSTSSVETIVTGNSQTITGINTPITLEINAIVDTPPENGLVANLDVLVNGTVAITLNIDSIGYAETILVNNNDTVQFRTYHSHSFIDSLGATIEVNNVSSSNTLLDSFQIYSARI